MRPSSLIRNRPTGGIGLPVRQLTDYLTASRVAAMASIVLIGTASTVLAQGFVAPARPGPYKVLIVRVLEGDHFDARVRIRMTTNPRWDERMRLRLSNANTPSPDSARECERTAGEEARDYVRRLVRGSALEARYLRQGRNSFERVAHLYVDGQDLGDLLISQGMAVPYDDVGSNPVDRHWECPSD